MMMIGVGMTVRSALREVVRRANIRRLEAGEDKTWTVRTLATAAGVAPSSVQALMADDARRVDFETLDRLCKVLNCEPGDILVRVDDPPSS